MSLDSRLREMSAAFMALHQRRAGEAPLLLPNPPDAGVAVALQTLGCVAVATSSSALAGTRGRLDGTVTLDECLEHARALADKVTVPVHVDFENGFADEPDELARNIERLAQTGVCSFSVEDFDRVGAIYSVEHATQRISAAVETAHRAGLVVTARAEGRLHGEPDLDEVLGRLARYADAGADVVFAPGLSSATEVALAVAATARPLNVLLTPQTPTLVELGELGVARVSTGSLLHRSMLGVIEPLLAAISSGDPSMWAPQRRGAALAAHAFASN